jgi:SAM-dependent MidA family methyltransferase
MDDSPISPDRVPLPMSEWTARVRWTDEAPAAEATLAEVAVQARILEEFRPLSESLEWRLAQLYWRRAGALPFAENEVPFLVNNSGRLSEAAARLLLASCLEMGRTGGPIVVLELGAGSGLFALLLLNAFRALCAEGGHDFYQRLEYVATDVSAATVAQWQQRRLFADHAGHVTGLVADANAPELPVKSARAVFCNYLLDVLPAAIVRREAGGQLQQLCVRTHLGREPATGRPRPTLTFEEMKAIIEAGDAEGLARLFPEMGFFEYEVAYRTDGVEALAGAADAADAWPPGARVRLSTGALRCLARCADRLEPDGFILVNDYGPVTEQEVPAYAALQKFGKTVASGLNFPWLEGELHRLGLHAHKAAGDDARSLHTRLLMKRALPGTDAAFQARFSEEAYRAFDALLEEARQHVKAGRKEEALAAYQQALARNRFDWALLGEITDFLTSQVGDARAARDTARAAVELNPHYSTWLWNLLGDALFNLEQFEEAHQSYLQAQRIDPRDSLTNLNLAYTHLIFAAHGQALEAIRVGLLHDVRGLYRERLLDKQRHVLSALTESWQAEQERLNRRNQRLG